MAHKPKHIPNIEDLNQNKETSSPFTDNSFDAPEIKENDTVFRPASIDHTLA
jgi:hypothetical protein